MASILSDLKATLVRADDPNAFPQWFWSGTNGNDLIRELNKYALKEKKGEDRIRREKDYPCVYGIVVNNFLNKEDGKWKLVKVGFTHKSIAKDSNNRMEQLTKQIGSELESTAIILFALRIGSVDTTPFRDTENRIRNKVGKPIKKEKAKEYKLPVPTEWVLTTDEHIDKITTEIGEIKQSMTVKYKKDNIDVTPDLIDAAPDLIDAFKKIKSPTLPSLPKEFKDWV